MDHVVAQVVEAELVVRAVGDVRGVRLLARDGPEVDESLVRAPVIWVVQVGNVVLDDADRQAEAMEDGTHPLRVALGQVIVHGHDVDAALRHRVQRRGQRGDEGLALAGLHLRDLSLVQRHSAEELDVEVAHAELAPAYLAGSGEDLGQRVVEYVLEVPDVLLFAGAAQLAAAFGAVVGELLLGRLGRGRVLEDLGAERDHPLADLFIGERLELGFECVDLVDDRRELLDGTVV